MDEELKKTKERLMKPDFTESLHHELIEMPPQKANQVIDAMTDREVEAKVNNRRFQEDYIMDYLMFLWSINKPAFWRQLKATFRPGLEVLWGDDMLHFEVMCTNKIPKDVFNSILELAISIGDPSHQDYKAIGCVISAQVRKFNGGHLIEKFIRSRIAGNRDVSRQLTPFIDCKCEYTFDRE